MYWMAYCITCMAMSVVLSFVNSINLLNYGDHKKGTPLNKERNILLSHIPEDHKGWFILFYTDEIKRWFKLATILIWAIGFLCMGYVHYTGQKTESVWPLYGKIILYGSIVATVLLIIIKMHFNKRIGEYVEFIKKNEDSIGIYEVNDIRMLNIYFRLRIYYLFPLEKFKQLKPEFDALVKSEFKNEINNPELKELVNTFRVVNFATFYYALLDNQDELNDKEIKLASYPAILGSLDATTIPGMMAMLGLVVFVISWIIKLF